MIVFENARVLDPASQVDAIRSVVIDGGRVEKLVDGKVPANESVGAKRIDCTDLWLTPGFIDLHVHLREPGEEYKETIESGARAAVAGGFTSVVAMPNTKPPIDNAHLIRFVAERAREAQLARVYPAGAVSRGQQGKVLAELLDMREAGAVCFTDDGRPVMHAGLMRRALEFSRTLGVPVMAHEEDLELAAGGAMNEGPTATRLGLGGHPAVAEEVMVLRDLALAELTGGHLHLGHLSVAGSVRAVREAKRRGVRVTAEVTPHHFTLTDEAVSTYDTHAKMCPPLRGPDDVQAVREGLADGTIDAIATDHAPHSSVEKDVEFEQAANGITGLETALPLCLALIRDGLLSPLRAIALLTSGPAGAFHLPGGRIAAGDPADLVLIDPKAEWLVGAGSFVSKSRNSPFVGWRMTGRALATYVGGRLVFDALGARKGAT